MILENESLHSLTENYRAWGIYKAADALGYTQSSISQMIASLENELGIKLLTRSRHGVKLTIEGAELFPFIERSIYQYRSMQEKANEIKGIETGIIRVGIISSVTCHWMPQLINGLQGRISECAVSISSRGLHFNSRMVASGQLTSVCQSACRYKFEN